MSKNEIIDNLYELSQCVLEVASDLEKDKMDINDVPKCFMELIDDSAKESEVEWYGFHKYNWAWVYNRN